MLYINKATKKFYKEQLLAAMKATSNKKMYIRYQCVYLHCDDMTITEIAKMFNLNYTTVRKYIDKYHTDGIESLEPKHRPGAPKKLTQEQENKLKETVTTGTPADVGFKTRMNWTADLAVQWVEREFGTDYTNSGMNSLFHRLGLSYTKPTYRLAKADPKKQEKFRQSFKAFKKTYWTGK